MDISMEGTIQPRTASVPQHPLDLELAAGRVPHGSEAKSDRVGGAAIQGMPLDSRKRGPIGQVALRSTPQQAGIRQEKVCIPGPLEHTRADTCDAPHSFLLLRASLLP